MISENELKEKYNKAVDLRYSLNNFYCEMQELLHATNHLNKVKTKKEFGKVHKEYFDYLMDFTNNIKAQIDINKSESISQVSVDDYFKDLKTQLQN
jgi:hypothetical protein